MQTEFGEREIGLDVVDLASDAEFSSRVPRVRETSLEIVALRRLARVFGDYPETVLQELVDIALEFCGADSAGVSLEDSGDYSNQVFRWVALSGKFKRFLNGTAPRFYSPCGMCLDRNAPQHFRVTKPYYDAMGISAEPVTDGILIPWRAEEMRGTIWIVAHESTHAFDGEDYRMMVNLADFAAIAVSHKHRRETVMKHAATAGAVVMASELAHMINNPLQNLIDTMHLVEQGGEDARELAQQATVELETLSKLTKKLLSLHGVEARQ